MRKSRNRRKSSARMILFSSSWTRSRSRWIGHRLVIYWSKTTGMLRRPSKWSNLKTRSSSSSSTSQIVIPTSKARDTQEMLKAWRWSLTWWHRSLLKTASATICTVIWAKPKLSRTRCSLRSSMICNWPMVRPFTSPRMTRWRSEAENLYLCLIDRW